jgi:peptidoglycan hydrolase-like protein with peptidoglycan-binding domain
MGVGLAGIDPSVISQMQSQMNNPPPPVGPGSPAQEVHGVQESLKDLGYKLDKQEDATDTYGASTQAAVRQFQKDHHLPETGIADIQTRMSISGAQQQKHQAEADLRNARDQFERSVQKGMLNLRG